MKDYLESTGYAVSSLFSAISDSSERLFGLDNSIHEWNHLENYLLGKDHNGRGPRNFDDWKKEMGEEPTVDSVRFWRAKLEAMADVRRETVNVLCASILMIAQNGIKRVLGSPGKWQAHVGTVLSSQKECLLSAIWHGRNLGAHVEGLTPGGHSFVYFEDVKSRRGVDLHLRSSTYPCTYIVKNLLGWIELHDLPIEDIVHTESYPSPYFQDMLRIGNLANGSSP